MDYDYSPTALKKVVYAGTQATSFPQGSRDLKELAELDISPERVRRATERIGKERVAERDAQAAAYEALSIPAQRAVPADQPTPAVACVQMDGGRYQFFDRAEPQRNEDDTFWREMKVGCLWSMTSKVSAEDPCPQLPASFVDPERMRRMVREIKGFSASEASTEDETEGHRIDERPGRPQPLARSVVATRHEAETFGRLLASEAYQRGFCGAARKAFVADGSEANWGVWRRHFSHYVPILDFIHALTYVYAAAMAGRALKEGWQAYRARAQWVWSGQTDRVIAALEVRQRELGEPTQGDSPDGSIRDRRQVAGILAKPAVADGLSRLPQARLADNEHLRGIDGETDQPANEGHGEVLVSRHRSHADPGRRPPGRHPHARPLLADPPPSPDRLPSLPILCRLKSQSGMVRPNSRGEACVVMVMAAPATGRAGGIVGGDSSRR